MYQLSRLLHDYHRDLYSHLEQQEIGPSLYATPWFLTAFASHFPLGFVARVFGKLRELRLILHSQTTLLFNLVATLFLLPEKSLDAGKKQDVGGSIEMSPLPS